MLLIIIYHLKSILSISDISILLAPINKELTQNSKSKLLETVYEKFIIIQNNIKNSQVGQTLSNNQNLFESLLSEKPLKNAETVENILCVLTLAVYSNTHKRLAEKLLDIRFK